jgi:multiple sugar transport system substrate-binding protein
VAAYPAVDDIAKAAMVSWKKHPTVEVKVVSRAFADHHTAMTTALSTSSNLPDVMVVEFGYVARFAEGGGLEDLGIAPYGIKGPAGPVCSGSPSARPLRPQALWWRCRLTLALAPCCIAPDILKKAGVTEADLTQSWDAYVAAGSKIKAATRGLPGGACAGRRRHRHPRRHQAR